MDDWNEDDEEAKSEFMFLAESNEFSPDNIDFDNPAALLKRQKEILAEIE